MAKGAEATIVSELFKFAETGQLYRGAKPVMWSPVEKTALAEAEIEYEDIVSTQIDVAFDVAEAPNSPAIAKVQEWCSNVQAVVWTTTPWTIPVNQGVAYNPDVEYSIVNLIWQPSTIGGCFVVASELVEAFLARLRTHPTTMQSDDTGIEASVVGTFPGTELQGAIALHPMHKLGGFFAKPRPFLPGDFVTTDQGTGLVHMAPDHGEDDFELCKANGIDPVFAVDAGGFYRPDWLWLGGQGSVINAKFNAPDGPICSDLRHAAALLAASTDFPHSYPHSWRSKAKVIYRCTPQWFIAMDKPLSMFSGKTRALDRWENEGGGANEVLDDQRPTLRQLALNAIAATRFIPEKGRNSMGSIGEGRPDWVLSRQRAWGVPIAVFVDRKSGELLV